MAVKRFVSTVIIATSSCSLNVVAPARLISFSFRAPLSPPTSLVCLPIGSKEVTSLLLGAMLLLV